MNLILVSKHILFILKPFKIYEYKIIKYFVILFLNIFFPTPRKLYFPF